MAHAEAQEAPAFTAVPTPPRLSIFAAIMSASPTKPPGLSSSNVPIFGSAANFAASPASIGPDASKVELSRQVNVMASDLASAASQMITATAIRVNISIAPILGS
jgi:hypothetical protein